jgi:integrase/recombinase XerD
MAQATVQEPGQYRHLLRVTEAISRDPAHDILVLLLGIHVGIRGSEIAQIELKTLLHEVGLDEDDTDYLAGIFKKKKLTK